MSVYIETGFNGDNHPLTNPRIGYSRPAYSSVGGSSAAAGFDTVNAASPRTDSAWRPTAIPAAWSYNYGSNTVVGYLGIAKHDLGTQNATVQVQVSTNGGGAYTTIPGLDFSPADDSAILCLFDPVSVTNIRINISAADDNPTIAVIAAGPVMEWPQPSTWIGTPITEGDQISFSTNRTDTGNWAGRTRVSDGLQFSMDVDNLAETFRTGEFAAFKSHANGEIATFFVAPRPGDYPNEVAYAWAREVVRMERDRPNARNAGSVTINMQGLRVNDR